MNTNSTDDQPTNNPHASPVPVEMIEKAAKSIAATRDYDWEVGLKYGLPGVIDGFRDQAEAALTAAGVPGLLEENTRLKAALKKIQRRATKGCQNHPPFSPVYRQAHAIGVIAQQALVAVDDPASFGL